MAPPVPGFDPPVAGVPPVLGLPPVAGDPPVVEEPPVAWEPPVVVPPVPFGESPPVPRPWPPVLEGSAVVLAEELPPVLLATSIEVLEDPAAPPVSPTTLFVMLVLPQAVRVRSTKLRILDMLRYYA